MIRLQALFFFVGFLLCVAGTSWGEQNKKLSVFATIEPQAYLLEKIGGDHLDVEVLVPTGQNLHTFEPTPRQIARLADSNLYFTIGLPLEKHLLGQLKENKQGFAVIDSSAGIERRAMESVGDDHGHGHVHHEHVQQDPHVWLDPQKGQKIAVNMTEALARHDPAHATIYRENLDRLTSELASTHQRISERLAPFAGRAIMVYHAAFGYFTDAYGLRQIAVEIGGRSPSAREMARLIDSAREHQIRVVFVQPQFSRSSAEILAEAIDGRVVAIDPLAADYSDNLYRMADAVHNALTD